MIQKEQVSRRKVEARTVNICRSRPPPEYVEDLEEDETPHWTHEVDYKQGNRLFVMRLLLESAAADLRAVSTISQKLVEGAHRALETQKGLFTLPDCVRGFESVVMPLENFLQKCNMGYTLYPWISLLESTLETSYKPQT